MAGLYRDLTGQRFGNWTVDVRDPSPPPPTHGSRPVYWLVTCDCGNEGSVRSSDLLSGHSKRCRECSLKLYAIPRRS
jgi:hypothetical protein